MGMGVKTYFKFDLIVFCKHILCKNNIIEIVVALLVGIN